MRNWLVKNWFRLTTSVIVLLLTGSLSYVGLHQYNDFQNQQLEKEKLANEQAEKIQEEKEEQNLEIEKLKEEVESLKNKKPEVIEVEKESAYTPTSEEISASEINPYLKGVVEVYCNLFNGDSSRGSGSLWNFSDLGYTVLTNFHVIKDNKDCTLMGDDIGVYSLNTLDVHVWNEDTDVAILKIGEPNLSPPVSTLNYKISTLPDCNSKMPIGSPILLIGYPAFSEQTVERYGYLAKLTARTVTDGIISAYDTSLKNLPHPNYFVSAKIDSGNSGGIAISKISSGLCVLGIPTWLTTGNYETQGIVQNIYNVKVVR